MVNLEKKTKTTRNRLEEKSRPKAEQPRRRCARRCYPDLSRYVGNWSGAAPKNETPLGTPRLSGRSRRKPCVVAQCNSPAPLAGRGQGLKEAVRCAQTSPPAKTPLGTPRLSGRSRRKPCVGTQCNSPAPQAGAGGGV